MASERGEGSGQVDGRGGLAYAALLIGDCDDPCHFAGPASPQLKKLSPGRRPGAMAESQQAKIFRGKAVQL